jgi:hypothetical protein
MSSITSVFAWITAALTRACNWLFADLDPQPGRLVPDRFGLDPADLRDLEQRLAAVAREEAQLAYEKLAVGLARLAAREAQVEQVRVDEERGSASVTFTDGTTLVLATADPEIRQVAAASRMVSMRLSAEYPQPGNTGRSLVFTAARWTMCVKATPTRLR